MPVESWEGLLQKPLAIGNMRIMEKKMETTIGFRALWGLRFRDLGFGVQGLASNRRPGRMGNP